MTQFPLCVLCMVCASESDFHLNQKYENLVLKNLKLFYYII